MSKCTFRNGRLIEDYGVPYIVAEVNSSHRGDMNLAKEMIDAAVNIGCDGVKFQSWTTDTLYSKSYYDANPLAKRFVDKFSLNPEQIKELSRYCESRNIDFSSTPYSEKEVDFLVEECNVPYIKIASMELNNLEYLRYIAEKKTPIVLSTGMGEIEEIKKAVEAIYEAGTEELILLHCISIYPAEYESMQLANILGLRELFPKCVIGFSDHTLGDTAAIAATAMGVGLIEKHLTLDRSKVGMDNGMATEPGEFEKYISNIKATQSAMGKKERIVSQAEYEQRKKMRRSVVSIAFIPQGTLITREMLCFKRPGDGIPPDEIGRVVGRVAKNDIDADVVILDEYLD